LSAIRADLQILDSVICVQLSLASVATDQPLGCVAISFVSNNNIQSTVAVPPRGGVLTCSEHRHALTDNHWSALGR
jgi:hypothetical protein